MVKTHRYIFKNKAFSTSFISAMLVTSSVYLLTQWLHTRTIADGAFVVALLFASTFLIRRMGSFYDHLSNECPAFSMVIFKTSVDTNTEFTMDGIEKLNRDMLMIFSSGKSLLTGLFFDIAFIVGVLLLGLWDGKPVIHVCFISLLAVANFVTGCALYTLIRFLLALRRWIQEMPIDIWHVRSHSILNIRKIKNEAVRTAAIYSSICLCAVLVSIIAVNELYIFYTVFSILILAFAFIYPEILVQRKIMHEQVQIVDDINQRIKVEFERLFKQSEVDTEIVTDLSLITELFSIREKTQGVIKESSFFSAVFSFIPIILVSVIPVLVQLILEMLRY